MEKLTIKRIPRIVGIEFNNSDWGITLDTTGFVASTVNTQLASFVNAGLSANTTSQLMGDVIKEMERTMMAAFDHDILKPFFQKVMAELYGEDWRTQ